MEISVRDSDGKIMQAGTGLGTLPGATNMVTAKSIPVVAPTQANMYDKNTDTVTTVVNPDKQAAMPTSTATLLTNLQNDLTVNANVKALLLRMNGIQ